MYEDIREELYRSYPLSEMEDEELYRVIYRLYRERYHPNFNSDEGIEKIIRRIFSSIRGLDILDELLEQEDISEIMVNAYDKVFIERKGQVLESPVCFDTEQALLDVIQRIVNMAGKEVNLANPIVDTRLSGGERVNIVLPPIAIDSPVVTIRRFPKERIRMATLISNGSITAEAADFLRRLVRARYNIFISGGTSSGKTTFLNALSDFIPEEERIITIEDSAELQLTRIKNIVRMETRNSNTAGAGEITMQQLIKTSLRMRPERIIVGEVRGKEALDMVLQGGNGLPLTAVRRDIASSLDIIVHLGKINGRRRAVFSIDEVVGLEEEKIVLHSLYRLENGELRPTGEKLVHTFKLREYGEEEFSYGEFGE